MPDAFEPLRTLAGRFDATAFDAPTGSARVRLAIRDGDALDAVVDGDGFHVEDANGDRADSLLIADTATWRKIAADVRGGMDAFRGGRLSIKRNLHLGVGFLAATSEPEPGRLRFHTIHTRLGAVSALEAGQGEPIVLLHGLGATKGEFLPMLRPLADSGRRVIAIDLPGFGDSAKPFPAAYDAPFFSSWVESVLDELGIERAHVLGHSMGGRVAIEFGLRNPDRTQGLILMTPSMAWLSDRKWAAYLRLVRPELGLLQPAPRAIVEGIVHRVIPGAEEQWTRIAIDEFLRAYLTPRGRVAFYAAARNIYLEDPDGPHGFWPRLEALQSDALFIWGKRDQLVPIGFERHVRDRLPHAMHEIIDCGHVPQLERPVQTQSAIDRFLRRPGAGRPLTDAPAAGAAGRKARAARGR